MSAWGGLGGRNVGVATRAFAFLLLDDAAPNARSLADAAFWLPPTPSRMLEFTRVLGHLGNAD